MPHVPGLARPNTLREDRADGSFVLRSGEPLQDYSRCVGDWLEHWAQQTPDVTAFAEPDGHGGWRELSWSALRRQVGAVAQSLLDMDLPAGRPVAILTDNGIEHVVLSLAAMHIGRPPCSVSSAYAKSPDHTRIRAILQTLRPALIYASDGALYGPAMTSCDVGAVQVVGTNAQAVAGALCFADLLRTPESAHVRERWLAIGPDDHAKYLLTSGSTGAPKVVINTHRMLCANQQSMTQVWQFLAEEKPVLLDWLPWSHTFGGNHNLNMILCHGGTLYIDDGRPMPGLIERTLHNMRQCRPTLHFNVPRGFEVMLPLLEADDALANAFLGSLRGVFYAGAALPSATWQRLQTLARRIRGEPLWLTTSWGATETAPAVTSAHFPLDQAGCIGVPLPGAELKFTPNGDKYELRVRGPCVFPGYRDAPDLTTAAFDDEGYYKIGDAGRLVDDAHPEQGVVFDGRVAEDFKLTSGTWVSVGTVRLALVSALSPLAQDAVITGHDRSELGALVFLSPAGQALPPEERRQRVQQALQQLRAGGSGSSAAPGRVLLMEEPPEPRRGRDHRQGLCEPARSAHAAQRIGDGAV